MKNKLHIFGCSHSTNHGVEEIDSWYHKLAEKLKIDYFYRTGQTGQGICNINFDMMDRISTNSIKNGDVVILNTSYSTRWSTISFPHIDNNKSAFKELIKKIESRNDLMHDESTSVYFKEEGGLSFTEDDMTTVTFVQWIIMTLSMYDILKKYTDNVYIWFLEDFSELEMLFNEIKKLNFNSLNRIGINPIHVADVIFKLDSFNKNDIINPPHSYQCWNDWIFHNSMINDSHMNKFGHHWFADYIYNFIKNKKTK